MKLTFTKLALARLIVGAVMLVSSGYVLLSHGEHVLAIQEFRPTTVLSPTHTVITNKPVEVVMQAPIGSMIELFEGDTRLIQKEVEGYSVVKLDLPTLSKGVHSLTAKVMIGEETNAYSLPPVVVYTNATFGIEDIASIALGTSNQEWDLNEDGRVNPKEEITYLLSRIEPLGPIAPVNPITDLTVVQTATTATYATFTFSKPVGAESVSLLLKGPADTAFREALTTNASDETYTVAGILPSSSYQFKLNVMGGANAGESNIVCVSTLEGDSPPIEIPPVEPSVQFMSFDGIDDYVQIEDNAVFHTSQSFTIEAWVKPETFKWKTGIVSKYQTQGQDSFTLRLSDGPPIYENYNKINFALGDNMELDSHANLELHTWYHLAALYDSTSGTMKLYVNGQLDSTNQGVFYKTNTSPISIGADFLQNARYFNGQIGEVRFWTTARSVSEILMDMNNHESSQSDPNLAGYWPLTSGAKDKSGNDRDGVVHGNLVP